MTYDGDGNRVSKAVSGVTTKYLVDTLTPAGYAEMAEELVNGSVNAQYLYGLMRISQSRTGVTSFYGYDGHGSVRQLTSAAGAVTDTYSYDAFGGLLTRTGSTQNSYMFAGEQYDVDVNMYYLRARWYNQRTGRFLTADHYEGPSIPNAATHHLFNYTNGDPVNGIDPTGRTNIFSFSFVIKYTAVIATGALALVAVHLVWEYLCEKEEIKALAEENETGVRPPPDILCRENPDEGKK